jgi:hypothetical protein
MLKSENIEIKISNSNIKYYRNIICDSLVNNMIIVIKTENLPLGSHIKITGICDICNSERILEYKSYNTQTNNGANIFTCSRKCSIEKAKITNLEKYGVENVFQNEKIKEKSKETCLNKYGVENYRKTD